MRNNFANSGMCGALKEEDRQDDGQLTCWSKPLYFLFCDYTKAAGYQVYGLFQMVLKFQDKNLTKVNFEVSNADVFSKLICEQGLVTDSTKKLWEGVRICGYSQLSENTDRLPDKFENQT